MNEQNPENTPPIQPSTPPNDNKRRLRELLSIAERDRTDEQWDEIIELEIQLAPGNRVSAAEQGSAQGSSGMGHNKPAGQSKKHRSRNNSNNRRSRQHKPTGNPL